MFKMLRCPKCNHYIIGQDDFFKDVTERINRNIVKIKDAKPFERKMIHEENNMYYYFMKQALRFQYDLNKAELRDTALLEEVLAFCRTYKLLSREELNALKETAYRKQRRQASDVSLELERMYGNYWSYCDNRSMPDPTAQKAMKHVMEGDRIRRKNKDEEMDPICTDLPYSPKFV